MDKIIDVISRLTGIPVHKLCQRDHETCSLLKRFLHNRVQNKSVMPCYGQYHMVIRKTNICQPVTIEYLIS